MCWVKICGITRREDAELALELGADALGFVLVRSSPRFIDPSMVRGMPGRKVGVFENESVETVLRIADEANLDAIQLHGDETPEMCARMDRPVIKAFRTRGNFGAYAVHSILVDGPDWALARDVPNVIVAGGLDAGNVRQAIALSCAFGVDVARGVESSPGVKDPVRMRAFFEKVRSS